MALAWHPQAWHPAADAVLIGDALRFGGALVEPQPPAGTVEDPE